MKVRKKFPSKVACVHCNGGCRANQSPEGYDLCLYGCTGCGACMEVCRFGAISLNSYGVAEVDESRCIGCGACAQVCPQHIDIPAALADLTKIIAEGPDWAKVSAERLKRDRK